MHKLVSICIPTYGRVEILKNTLESFYSVDISENAYEICISDNSPTDETKEMLERFFSNKTNIVYKKSKCEGYYNSIEALKLGRGTFLKLHNNYTKVNHKFVSFMECIDLYKDSDSVIFFTFGEKKMNEKKCEFKSFDEFMFFINCLSTWSTSFGLWKSDFDFLMRENRPLDKMFPHTSLLFRLTNKSKYVVDDVDYFENQDVGKKGGYNLPDTFGTRFLGMCELLLKNEIISEKTFDEIKMKILDFVSIWFFKVKFYPQKYYFSFDNWEKTIKILYDKKAVSYVKRNYVKNCLKNCFLCRSFRKVMKMFFC